MSGRAGTPRSSSPDRDLTELAGIINSGAAGRIGTDESGKGDYFGPLVVAAVWADAATGSRMANWGVADSKKLTDKRAATLAGQIAAAGIPHAVVAIGPEKYNQLYAKMRNLNHLLAWAHARAMENLLGSVSAEVMVADQFGDEALIERALMEKGRRVRLFQMPRGERDIAVAAASVVARDGFLRRLHKLSAEIGIRLPKGAGPPVDAAAAEIIRRLGAETLTKIAKCHFKNTTKAQKLAW